MHLPKCVLARLLSSRPMWFVMVISRITFSGLYRFGIHSDILCILSHWGAFTGREIGSTGKSWLYTATGFEHTKYTFSIWAVRGFTLSFWLSFILLKASLVLNVMSVLLYYEATKIHTVHVATETLEQMHQLLHNCATVFRKDTYDCSKGTENIIMNKEGGLLLRIER
jgi:hypothetical protein